jgi:hypothetical protein
LTLGQTARAVRDPGQFGVQLRNFEQRALLRDCGFHQW